MCTTCIFVLAATCGDPGTPANGGKDGSMYYYPHKVKFSCFHGYKLEGAKQITCQANSKWSNTIPKCIGSFFILGNTELH